MRFPKLLLLLPLLALSRLVPAPPAGVRTENCRLCGLLAGPYTPRLAIPWILDRLRPFGAANPNGWGVAWFPRNRKFMGPISRRGGRPANEDPRFPRAAWEAALHRPRAILGHVRLSSTVLAGIPDPHPFVREGLALAHNGTVNRAAFFPLVLPFLKKRPPDYRDLSASARPEFQVVDSELLFIYLLGRREARGGDTAAAMKDLALAVRRVDPFATVNLLVSDGRSLWALSRGAPGNLLRFFHEPFTGTVVVASEGVAPSWWAQIPDWTILVASRKGKIRLVKV